MAELDLKALAGKKPKWAYALVVLVAVLFVAVALVAYRNPLLFRGYLGGGFGVNPGGVPMGSGIPSTQVGFTEPKINSTIGKVGLNQSKTVISTKTIEKPFPDGGGTPPMPEITPPIDLGLIPGSELQKEVVRNKNVAPSNALTVNATPIAPSCGNGAVESGEACDDSSNDGIGCATGCGGFATGWSCSGAIGQRSACVCASGYLGSDCHQDLCYQNTCGGHGICSVSSGSAMCACAVNWTGADCSTAVVPLGCPAASACFTDADASKVDDYLLGAYTLQAGEAVKYDTNCSGSVTEGDSAYISDHISNSCP